MKYDELTEKHANEYKEYLIGYKDSLEMLHDSRQKVLLEAQVTEATIPPHIGKLLTRDLESWQNEWGMYGTRFKNMRLNQQKEINQYFDREKVVYRLTKEMTDKTGKDNTNGR